LEDVPVAKRQNQIVVSIASVTSTDIDKPGFLPTMAMSPILDSNRDRCMRCDGVLFKLILQCIPVLGKYCPGNAKSDSGGLKFQIV
jgi:hypothetical protein